MFRALVMFLLVLGIVAGGLMLLRRTAGKPPKEYRKVERIEDEDDRRGW